MQVLRTHVMKVRRTGRQHSEKEMKYLEIGRITKRYTVNVYIKLNFIAALVVRDSFLTNTYIKCECNSRAALRTVLCTPTAYLKAHEVLNFPDLRKC